MRVAFRNAAARSNSTVKQSRSEGGEIDAAACNGGLRTTLILAAVASSAPWLDDVVPLPPHHHHEPRPRAEPVVVAVCRPLAVLTAVSTTVPFLLCTIASWNSTSRCSYSASAIAIARNKTSCGSDAALSKFTLISMSISDWWPCASGDVGDDTVGDDIAGNTYMPSGAAVTMSTGETDRRACGRGRVPPFPSAARSTRRSEGSVLCVARRKWRARSSCRLLWMPFSTRWMAERQRAATRGDQSSGGAAL